MNKWVVPHVNKLKKEKHKHILKEIKMKTMCVCIYIERDTDIP